MGHNEVEVAHAAVEGECVGEILLTEPVDSFLHTHYLGLQLGVAAVEVAVYLAQVEVAGHIVGAFVDRGGHSAGRGHEHVPAVGVVVEQQSAADRHEECEDQPFAVADDKSEKLVHDVGPIAGLSDKE